MTRLVGVHGLAPTPYSGAPVGRIISTFAVRQRADWVSDDRTVHSQPGDADAAELRGRAAIAPWHALIGCASECERRGPCLGCGGLFPLTSTVLVTAHE